MALKRIVILGAGGQARETRWLIEEINRNRPSYEFVGFVVGDLASLTDTDSQDSVLGDESWLDLHRDRFDCLALGLANPLGRLNIARKLSEQHPACSWPLLIHPSAIYDAQSCRFGSGAHICAGTVCTINVQVDSFALLNFGVTVGHEARIGSGAVVNPGANVSGGVVIEEGVLVGTGAQILQYRRIGAGATVGAGAVVTRNVGPGVTVVGIPALPKRIDA